MDPQVFSQLAWISSSTQNFSLCFQVCFNLSIFFYSKQKKMMGIFIVFLMLF